MTIAAIIPVFNRLELAIRAVASVLRQTQPADELLVVDDGSSEDLTALKKLVEAVGGKFYRISHLGVSAARNFGFKQSKSAWLAFLDSDDEWFDEKLERQRVFLENNPETLLLHAQEEWIRDSKFVNPKLRHAPAKGDCFERALELCCISPSAVMIRRDIFSELGGFDERMRVCEDYDLWLRFTAKFPVGLVEETLVRKYGGHADQLSRAEQAPDRFRIFAILKLLLEGNLDPERSKIAREALATRAAILFQGAEKRKLKGQAKFYESLLDEKRCFSPVDITLALANLGDSANAASAHS